MTRQLLLIVTCCLICFGVFLSPAAALEKRDLEHPSELRVEHVQGGILQREIVNAAAARGVDLASVIYLDISSDDGYGAQGADFTEFFDVNLEGGVVSFQFSNFISSMLPFLQEIQFSGDAQPDYIPATTFMSCNTLVLIGGLDYVAVVGSSAFDGCANLSTLDIASLKLVESKAFSGCSSLRNVPLSQNATVGDGAFFGCTLLGSLGSGTLTSVGKNAFQGCKNLYSVTLDDGAEVGFSAFKGCTTLKSVSMNQISIVPPIVPDEDDGPNADSFSGCTALEGIHIASATSLYEGAFSGCTSLTSAILGDSSTVSSALFPDSPLKSLKVGNDSLIQERIFQAHPKLSVFEIGDNGRIHAGAFKNCSKLSSVVIGKNSELFESAFENCGALTTVSMGTDVAIGSRAFFADAKLSAVSGTVVSVGSEAFSDCASLANISLANGIFVGGRAFSGCSKLSALGGKLGKVGSGAFLGCAQLAQVEIVNGAEIQSYGFQDCIRLEGVTGTLGIVGQEAFSGCAKLRSVSFPAQSTYGMDAFRGCALDFTKAAPGGLNLANAKDQHPYALFKKVGSGTLTVKAGESFDLAKLYTLTTASGTPYSALKNPPYYWLDTSFHGDGDHSPKVTVSGKYDAQVAGQYPLTLMLPSSTYADAHQLSVLLTVIAKEVPSSGDGSVGGETPMPSWIIPSSFRATKGFTYSLVSKTDASAAKLTFSSGDPRIVKVDAQGVITGVKVGSTVITATDGSNLKQTCKVTVYNNAFSRAKPLKGSGVVVSTKRLYYANGRLYVEIFIWNNGKKALRNVTGLQIELWDNEKKQLLFSKPVQTLMKNPLKVGKYTVYTTAIGQAKLGKVATEKYDLGHGMIEAKLTGFK